MPSSAGYKRDIPQEEKTAKARGETGGHNSPNAERKRARRAALKMGMVKPGQDWNHKRALSQGGSNKLSNGNAETPHDNRSFPRRPDGSMIANHPKKAGPK